VGRVCRAEEKAKIKRRRRVKKIERETGTLLVSG